MHKAAVNSDIFFNKPFIIRSATSLSYIYSAAFGETHILDFNIYNIFYKSFIAPDRSNIALDIVTSESLSEIRVPEASERFKAPVFLHEQYLRERHTVEGIVLDH